MKKEDFEKLTNGMKEKLGEENIALIADDISTLLTDNNLMNTQIEDKNKEIQKLKDDKEMLISTNGNLLQKISMGFEEDFNKQQKEEDTKKYDIHKAFDERGNFK